MPDLDDNDRTKKELQHELQLQHVVSDEDDTAHYAEVARHWAHFLNNTHLEVAGPISSARTAIEVARMMKLGYAGYAAAETAAAAAEVAAAAEAAAAAGAAGAAVGGAGVMAGFEAIGAGIAAGAGALVSWPAVAVAGGAYIGLKAWDAIHEGAIADISSGKITSAAPDILEYVKNWNDHGSVTPLPPALIAKNLYVHHPSRHIPRKRHRHSNSV